METTISTVSNEQPQQLAVDWAESEWFQVWLRLARHEPQDAEQHSPPWPAYAAAA